MAQYSRLLRDNPSDFPYDFEKQILSKQSADTIYHWHPELEIIYVKKELLPCISILSALKVMKAIFF